MDDACAIADVAQDMMSEGTLQLVASFLEEGKLMAGEVVEAVAVATHEV